MKKLFIAFMLMLWSVPVFAQPYQNSDWLDGSIPTRNWAVPSSKPTGAAPADTFEPADVSDSGFTESDWIITTDGNTDYVQGAGHDRKIRIQCDSGKNFHGDPILFPGVAPPVGHKHQGIGNIHWDQNSTFNTLRASPSSTCSGGPLNGTIYWAPEMQQITPTGYVAGIRSQVITFYYISGLQTNNPSLTWLRRNFRFIGGANPNDYNDSARRAEYAAAGYLYPGGPDLPAGFIGWQCYRDAAASDVATVTRVASRAKSMFGVADPLMARHLKAEDGSDPWGGTCTGSIASPGTLLLNLIAPGCWDRHNLQAPDGRGHMAYAATKADSSVVGACPKMTVNGVTQEYGGLPQLTSKEEFRHAGFADYGTWFFSSDRMNPASTPGDATSKDPCRQIGPYFCNGSTGHFDWIYGWKSAIIDEWQRECIGITVRGVAPTNGPAECGTSQISKFRKLKYTGASPDPTMSGNCAVINSCSNAVPGNKERFVPIAPGTKATITVKNQP
jgi:hypothetical protein